MKVTILPTTNLLPEDVLNYGDNVILYGPETIQEMLSKYPFADGYIVELGARIYIRKSSPIMLPQLVLRKDFHTARASTMIDIPFNLKKHPGLNILTMTPGQIADYLNITQLDTIKMKYREHSTIILGENVEEFDKLMYWKLNEKMTFVSKPFYPCEFIEELSKYYDVETKSPKGNNTPCYL